MQLISVFFILVMILFLDTNQCGGDETQLNIDYTTTTTLPFMEDSDDDYIDYVDGKEVSKQSRQRNQSEFDRVGTFYKWDRWEKWSKCATTCVQIKKRKCIERTKNSTDAIAVENRFYPAEGKIGCFGVLKRYRQCRKEERCKAGKQQRLRDEQCERFNSVPYRETFYNWVGYEKEHDECMLFCRGVNTDLFISMNRSVTDGTPCNRPAVYYTHFYRRQAVCVEGTCRAVHSSGLIRPVTTRDSQVKCGSVLCKHIIAIFNRTNLIKGHNYITTLPVGTMNLSIRQNIKANNSLALKSPDEMFVINGDRSKISDNGNFNFNNDTFEYNQTNGLLTARGPLSKAAILMYSILGDIKGTVNDIQYNYTIPISSPAISEEEELQAIWDEAGNAVNFTDVTSYTLRIKERKRRKFSWKLLGFGVCNRSCGPGTQTPIFRCVCMRDSSLRYYSPRRCAQIEKPTFSDDIYNCNRGLCPAFWRPSTFRNCHCPDGSSHGQRTRHFECMQEQIKGNVIQVPDNLCPVRHDQPEACRCIIKNQRVPNDTFI